MTHGDRSRSGERSPEERERDRQERERRRALRAGGADDAPSPVASEPAARPVQEEHALDAPELTPEDAAAPADELAAQPLDPPLLSEPEPPEAEMPVAPPPAPEPVAEPLPHEHLPPESEPLPPEPVAPEPEALALEPGPHEPQAADPEIPHEAHDGGLLPPPPEPRYAAGAGTVGGHRRRRSVMARVVAVIALAVVIGIIVLLAKSLGSSSSKKVAAGPAITTIVIPEGKTRMQIAQIAAAHRLTGSYRVSSRRSPLLNPSHYGAPKGTPDLEGFLFPATYELDAGAPARRLVEEQLVAFKEHFGAREFSRAHALNVTPYELLTVASMIEREAVLPGDRPKVAAVIYNRLKEGMPIGIDASIYYAVELRRGIATYEGELTEADLHINSPYNTRTHTGLPPTPISNAGDASIHAAAYPAQVPYLYYVAGADGCGEQVFSTTSTAFEANVAAYNAAVAKNGGHPPTCKHK